MKKPTTIKELCEFIWYLEDKYDLLNFELDGVKVWQYSRMIIYYELAYKLNILDPPNKSQKNIKMIFKNIFSLLKNAIIYNPLLNFRNVDNIIFTHNRSKKIDGEYIDIYTKYFIDDLKKSGESYLCYEKPFHNQHLRKKDSNTVYLDFILSVSILYGKLYRIKNDKKLKKLKSIEDEINNLAQIKFKLLELARKNTGRFKLSYQIYHYIFSKIKPKKVFAVVAYIYLGDMLKAAKDLKIDTIEFQHGIISKYHLGYSYPKKETLDYMTNTFYSWGNFWHNPINNIFDKKNIIEYGFDYFNKVKNSYKTIQKKKNKIIIISQTALGNEIMNYVSNIIESLKSYSIVYKLHPEEYTLYKSYRRFEILSQYNNIQFLENCDLYKEFSESEYQMGVFSTALYEGLNFQCKTIIFDLNGVEYIQELIHEELAVLYNKQNDILKTIKTKIKVNSDGYKYI